MSPVRGQGLVGQLRTHLLASMSCTGHGPRFMCFFHKPNGNINRSVSYSSSSSSSASSISVPSAEGKDALEVWALE